MRYSRFYTLFLCFSLLLGGCASIQQKQLTQIAKGVYATKESIEKGRIDLAKKYIDSTSQLLPPPKDRVKINAFPIEVKTGNKTIQTPTVVLPKELDKEPIIIEDTPEYQNLLAENERIRKLEEQNEKALSQFTKKTDSVVAEEIKRGTEKRSSWFNFGIGAKILGFGSIGLIIAVIVLSFVFPEILPIVLSVLGRLKDAANFILGLIENLIKKK